MNAQTKIDPEAFAEAIQARADDLRSAETYEVRVRIKSVKQVIAEAEATMSRKDAEMESCARRKAALRDQITALQEQFVTEEQNYMNLASEWGDARVALVKGHRELAELAERAGQ